MTVCYCLSFFADLKESIRPCWLSGQRLNVHMPAWLICSLLMTVVTKMAFERVTNELGYNDESVRHGCTVAWYTFLSSSRWRMNVLHLEEELFSSLYVFPSCFQQVVRALLRGYCLLLLTLRSLSSLCFIIIRTLCWQLRDNRIRCGGKKKIDIFCVF